MDREEGQSRNNENHGKSHGAERYGIRLQRSGRLGNILLARQKPGDGNLADNTWFWNYSCGIVLILSRFIPIIGQPFKPGTVIGSA